MLLSYPTSGGGSRMIPVMYSQSRGDLLVAAAHPERKRWWRNLRIPTPVRVRVRGTELDAIAVLLTDAEEVEQATAAYLQRFPRAAVSLRGEGDNHGEVAAGATGDRGVAVIVRASPKQGGSTPADHRSIWPWGWMLPFVITGSIVHRGGGWPTHLPALAGPLIAAVLVTAWVQGTSGLRGLVRRMIRWRIGVRWWFWGLGSPLVYFAAGALLGRVSDGRWPSLSGLDRDSGIPAIGAAGVWLVAVVAGLGEETGWRGFALPQLQRRYGPLAASLIIVPMWALWHAPLFAVLASYRDFGPMQYPGFVFGLACGSVVLTWLYNRSGSSILIVAVWHGTFNMVGGATAASEGTIAAVVSTAVMIQAIVLIALELWARHRRSPSVLGPV